MAKFQDINGEVEGLVAGDNFALKVTDSDLPFGDTVTKAWFTVKKQHTDLDAAALFQKTITASYVLHQGQITADGSSGPVLARFECDPVDTALLIPWAPGRIPVYDVKFLTASGQVYRSLLGKILFPDGVTRAVS